MLKLAADLAPSPETADTVAPSHTRHTLFTRCVHWTCATLLLLGVAAVLAHGWVEDTALRAGLLTAHRQLGTLGILGLTVRLANRCTGGMRHVRHELPALMQWAATLTHLGLYAMLLAVPVLGWAESNAHNVQVSLLGLHLPQIAESDPELADRLDDYHTTAAWALLATAAAHIAAALFHHFVQRDTVLTSMLPQRRPR
jgi:cytochrome b561